MEANGQMGGRKQGMQSILCFNLARPMWSWCAARFLCSRVACSSSWNERLSSTSPALANFINIFHRESAQKENEC